MIYLCRSVSVCSDVDVNISYERLRSEPRTILPSFECLQLTLDAVS